MTASSPAIARPDTPRDVKLAVSLFAAAVVVGVVDFVLQRIGVSSVQSEILSSPVSLLFGIVLTAVFLALIMNRQNWARILFAVLTGLGVLFAAPVVLTELGDDPIGAVLSVIQVGLQIAALILLFRPSSNFWFSSR